MRRRQLIELSGAGLAASFLSPSLAAESISALVTGNPWRTRQPANRLLAPLYRPPGAARFVPTSNADALRQIASRVLQTRSSRWSEPARRAEGLGFYLDTDLTNEEAYLWGRLARQAGGRLERRFERQALAVARAFETTFGQPAAPNHWFELTTSRGILLFGETAQTYPAYQQIAEARRRGARLWQIAGSTSSLQGGTLLPVTPESEVALLGGLIHYLIENKRIDREYLELHTNGLFRLVQDFDFRDGRFSGYNAQTRNYDPQSWSYEFQESGRPARVRAFGEEGSVFAQIARFYAPFTLQTVSRATGVAEPVLTRFFDEFSAPERRPLSIVYALEISEPGALIEQKLRSAAIVSLLLGQVGRPGGGLVVLAPGWNFQGTADVGALGGSLPGYSGPPPLPGEELISWIRRVGTRNQRRLLAVLHRWYEGTSEDFGFDLIGTARPGEGLRTAKLDTLICVGSDPQASEAWPLDHLKTLVVLSPDANNRTARFWEKKLGTKTEVFFLPLAHPLEREGSITDTGRRIVFLKAERRPQGQSEHGLTFAHTLWTTLRDRLGRSDAPRDRSVRSASAFPAPQAQAVLREMYGEGFENPSQIDRSEKAGASGCGVPIYAGLNQQLLDLRRSSEDPTGLGLYPNFGYAWPGDVRVLGNRASADAQGKSRIEPAFITWNGKAWIGPDTPDVIDPELAPAEPGVLRSFRGTPEGVARLFAANYAGGFNLDTGIAYSTAPLPILGPLPAYYVPWGSRRLNPLSPRQPEPPVAPA